MPSQRILVALAAAFFFSILMTPKDGEAQNIRALLQPPYRDDVYVDGLVKVFEEWNAKSLAVPEKAKLKEAFERRLRRVMDRKRYAYQDENWAKEMRAKFEAMPAVVKPEVAISIPAQVTLTALYLKDIADFKKEVVLPRVREELMLPVFLVLGKAQGDAVRVGKKDIESVFVGQSLFFWWTTTWPFCD